MRVAGVRFGRCGGDSGRLQAGAQAFATAWGGAPTAQAVLSEDWASGALKG